MAVVLSVLVFIYICVHACLASSPKLTGRIVQFLYKQKLIIISFVPYVFITSHLLKFESIKALFKNSCNIC